VGVHGLPEAIVPVHHELAVSRRALERLALEDEPALRAQVAVDERSLEDEEAAGDRAGARLRLLGEPADARAAALEPPEAAGPAEGQRAVVQVRLVGEEEVLDRRPLVAQEEHELAKAMVSVELHYVPEDRPPAHVDERLRQVLGDVANPRPLPAAEDHDFHDA